MGTAHMLEGMIRMYEPSKPIDIIFWVGGPPQCWKKMICMYEPWKQIENNTLIVADMQYLSDTILFGHEIITKIIPWELFFVIFEGICPLNISGKERLFPEITREIRNFSKLIIYK